MKEYEQYCGFYSFACSADSFQNYIFSKKSFWGTIRCANVFWILISVQNVCKGCQQMTNVESALAQWQSA